MDAKVNYTVVGIFILVLSITLIYIIFWLTAGVSSKSYETYVAYMRESVSGLSVQSPVKYNGVQVGYVSSITLNPNDPTQVRLLLNIESDIPIRVDTTATLESQGLTGIAYIGLRGGSPHARILHATDSQEYPVIHTRPSLLLRLDSALRNLTGNLDSITSGIKSILDKDNTRNFKKILANLESATTVIANNSKRLNNIVFNLDDILKNTKKASQEFPTLVTNANKTLSKIDGMAKVVKHSGAAFAKAAKKASIGITQVVDQISPQLYRALSNFTSLSQKLRAIASELQNNPSMLIRGKYPSRPGPGES